MLRLITEEPWRTHGPELVTRESVTQHTLASTDIPSPRSLAIDPDGAATGHPAHLMTLVPGAPDETRCDDGSLAAIARLLAWAARPELWERAFDLLAEDPPIFVPTFLHRDFGPHNLLWTGEVITGLVDWEVMDVVGFLPPPGRKPMLDDPGKLARLEEHLAWAMADDA